jgi:hypothetical protein
LRSREDSLSHKDPFCQRLNNQTLVTMRRMGPNLTRHLTAQCFPT